MLTITHKFDTKFLSLGALIAPIIEKRLKDEFDLPRLEQNVLLLTHLYIESGVRVTGPVLIRTKMAHPRNVRGAIKELVDAGYLEKKKVERRMGLKILLTDKGGEFVSRTLRIVKQQYKSLVSE